MKKLLIDTLESWIFDMNEGRISTIIFAICDDCKSYLFGEFEELDDKDCLKYQSKVGSSIGTLTDGIDDISVKNKYVECPTISDLQKYLKEGKKKNVDKIVKLLKLDKKIISFFYSYHISFFDDDKEEFYSSYKITDKGIKLLNDDEIDDMFFM